jgi:hypothetical protein
MFRHVVPVDDRAYSFPLSHSPVAVAAFNDSSAVEFWVEHTLGAPAVMRWFQVFGTGRPLPDGARWIGTCPRTPADLVWHLYEVYEVSSGLPVKEEDCGD